MLVTSTHKSLRRTAALVAVGLLLASCGSDDEPSSSSNGSDDEASISTEAPETAEPEPETEEPTPEEDSETSSPPEDGEPSDPPVDSSEPASTDGDGGGAEDGGDSGGDSAGEPCVGSGDGSGEAIVVGQIQTEESAAAGFPELTDGAQACFDAINATGGVNGRPIDFQPCNDSADPVQGETCARDLIDAGAVAVLGGICFSCFSAPVVDILGDAGVPYVGGLPVLPGEYTNENFYPITNAGGSAALFANAAWIMSTAETKGVDPTVVEIYAAVGEADPTLEQQIDKLGGQYITRIGFDPASADLSSIAQQAIDESPNFVSVQTDGPNTVKLVTALRTQGFEGDIVILGTAADPQSIEGMGDASEGVFVAAFFEDLASSESPDAVKFRADLEASGGDPGQGLSATGYGGALVVATAIEAAGDDVTPESLLAALTSLEPIEPLFNGQLAASNANEDFPRTYYFASYANTIQDGEITPTGEVFNFYTGEPIG